MEWIPIRPPLCMAVSWSLPRPQPYFREKRLHPSFFYFAFFTFIIFLFSHLFILFSVFPNFSLDFGPDVDPDVAPDIGPDISPDVGPDFSPDFSLLVTICPSPTDSLISLSYSMAVFSANLFGPFFNSFLILRVYKDVMPLLRKSPPTSFNFHHADIR